MKVLVTGAGGYIGSVVARDLQEFHPVRGIDMRPMPDLPDSRVIDLNDHSALEEAMSDMDTLAHLAWPMGPYEGYDPLEHSDLGAGIHVLYDMLTMAVKMGIKRMVFQSTINITGPSWDNWRITEDILPRPGIGGYTLGKTLAEELCRSFAREHDLTIAVFRIGGVPTLEESGREGAAPDQHGVPSSCIERRDIAQAYHLALTRPLPSRFEIFHIFHSRPSSHFPNTKAKEILGFEPKYNYEELWRKK